MDAFEAAGAMMSYYTWDDEPEVEVAEEKTKEFRPTSLTFTESQPSVFYEDEEGVVYRGQDKAKTRLDVKIQALDDDGRLKALLVGGAGTGKTTLAWILARRIREEWKKRGFDGGRFFELLPAQIEDKSDLDVFVSQLKPRDVVFIDEIHILQQAIGPEAFFHTLDDTGVPRYPLGHGEGWIDVPKTVSWIGATTDPGEMDKTTGEALRRRFTLEVRLEAPDDDTLVRIVKDQPSRITDSAAVEIARRSGGLPWQAISVYNESRDFAKVMGDGLITDEFAHRAFDAMGLDEHGLLPEDRAALRVLINLEPYELATKPGVFRYKMAEPSLIAAAGLDRETYKTRVQPKIMRLGYITTTGGQTLTEKALRDYAHLKETT